MHAAFREPVPQRGKYNLYYTFGKGYINQVKSLREHYGATTTFSTQRLNQEDSTEDIPDFLGGERRFSNTQEMKSRINNNQRLSSFKNRPPPSEDEHLNKSQNFDKFLKNPEFEIDANGIIQDKNASLREVTLSSSLKKRTALEKIRFGSSNRKERFENLKFDKKYDFPAEYSDINFLVTRENMKNQKAVGFYRENFEIKPKNFEMKKTDLLQNVDRLTTPLEKRLEIQDVKKNKEKYLNWKHDFMNSQKKYRITKSSYKSGILDIDNPQNELTRVYQTEYEDFKKKEAAKALINQRHQEQLRDFTKTHHDIAFFNKNHSKNNEKNNENSKDVKISTNWTGKARIKENFFKNYQDSHDRLFGAFPNKYSIPRAEKIMSCENKGKNWDIISWKVNDVQLKVDKGVNDGV